MNKYTPGEWIAVFPKGQFPHIQTSDGKQVAKTDCSIGSERWVENYCECVANARLIASAPELLEALETIARGNAKDVGPNGLGTVSFDFETAKQIARTAIKKVRGK